MYYFVNYTRLWLDEFGKSTYLVLKPYGRNVELGIENPYPLLCSNFPIISCSTIMCTNNEKNDQFYRKVAFLMYSERVNFRPQSWKEASKLKTTPRTGN